MPNVRAAIQRHCCDLEKWVVKTISHTKHCVVKDEFGILFPSENGEAIERLKDSLQVQRNFAWVHIWLYSPLVVLVSVVCLATQKMWGYQFYSISSSESQLWHCSFCFYTDYFMRLQGVKSEIVKPSKSYEDFVFPPKAAQKIGYLMIFWNIWWCLWVTWKLLGLPKASFYFLGSRRQLLSSTSI